MAAIFGRFLASWFQHLSMIWYLRERKVVMYVEHRQASLGVDTCMLGIINLWNCNNSWRGLVDMHPNAMKVM